MPKQFSNKHQSSDFDPKIKEILEDINQQVITDIPYESGRILGAMTTKPHPVASYVYQQFLDRNLGDSGLNPGTKQLEENALRWLASIHGGTKIKGNFTSGGTESNLIGMFMALRSHPNVKKPNIIVSEAAHYSLEKAAHLLKFELRKAQLNDDFTVNLSHFESLRDDNTVGVCGILGTSALGMVDPLHDIGKIASEYKLYYHIDAAYGGMVQPFIRSFESRYNFHVLKDFPVSSIAIDPHKMGMAVIPTGTFLYNTTENNGFPFKIDYLAGGTTNSFNITGTRPGAPVVAFYALLKYLGVEGYRKLFTEGYNIARYAREQLESFDFIEIVASPSLNVLGIRPSRSSKISTAKLNIELRKRGYNLGFFTEMDIIRLVFMPHVKIPHVDQFLSDLKVIF